MIIDSSMKVAALINLKRSLLDTLARVHRRPTDPIVHAGREGNRVQRGFSSAGGHRSSVFLRHRA
jgi:hypothetical protein